MNYYEIGLLDIGENVSCIGSTLAKESFTNLSKYKAISQLRLNRSGILKVLIRYKDKEKELDLYVIISISQ